MSTLVIFPHWHLCGGAVWGNSDHLCTAVRLAFLLQSTESSSQRGHMLPTITTRSLLPALYLIKSLTTMEHGSTKQLDHPPDPNHSTLHPLQKHAKV